MTQAVNLAQVGAAGATTGFKNKLINGNFDFWQRGTTNTITTAGYTVADRWQYITDGTLGTGTVFTQQTFTLGQTAVPNNPTYFLQLACTSVNTPTNYVRQRIEKVSTLSGQTATASFWLRTTSGTASCKAQFQQEFGTGGSPSAGVYAIGDTTFTITTTWTQYSITAAIPSIAGKTIGTDNNDALNIGIYFPVGGASGTYQVAQVQVEVGTAPTTFDLRPLQVELALCQRYYEVCPYDVISTNGGQTGQPYYKFTPFKSNKRGLPTMTYTPVGAAGFTNSPTTNDATVYGIAWRDTTPANGGPNVSWYSVTAWTANAEL